MAAFITILPRPLSHIRTSITTPRRALFKRPTPYRAHITPRCAADTPQTPDEPQTPEEPPFELRGFSLANVFLLAGGVITITSFSSYINSSGTASATSLGFVYGVPILLIGCALKYAELQPVSVESTPEAATARTEKGTEIQQKIYKDITRHRYGDEAHLSAALASLGLIPRGEACPVLEWGKEMVVDGEYALQLVFTSAITPYREWESRIEKFERFFGPDVKASVKKVDAEKRLVGLTLTSCAESGPLSEDPKVGTSLFPHSTKVADMNLPEGWQSVQDAHGRTYYHDTKTGKTSWTLPNPPSPADDKPTAPVMSPSSSYISGQPYSTESSPPYPSDSSSSHPQAYPPSQSYPNHSQSYSSHPSLYAQNSQPYPSHSPSYNPPAPPHGPNGGSQHDYYSPPQGHPPPPHPSGYSSPSQPPPPAHHASGYSPPTHPLGAHPQMQSARPPPPPGGYSSHSPYPPVTSAYNLNPHVSSASQPYGHHFSDPHAPPPPSGYQTIGGPPLQHPPQHPPHHAPQHTPSGRYGHPQGPYNPSGHAHPPPGDYYSSPSSHIQRPPRPPQNAPGGYGQPSTTSHPPPPAGYPNPSGQSSQPPQHQQPSYQSQPAHRPSHISHNPSQMASINSAMSNLSMGGLGSNSGIVPISLEFRAVGLRDRDIIGKSDPVLHVLEPSLPSLKQSEASQWKKIASTEVVKNTVNPTWAKRVNLRYCFERHQPYRFEIVDVDNFKTMQGDKLGFAESTLADIVRNGVIRLKLSKKKGNSSNCGDLTIRAHDDSSTEKIKIQLLFGGKNLDKKDFLGKSDPYYKLSRVMPGAGGSSLLYKSEEKMNDCNPTWRPHTVMLSSGNTPWTQISLAVEIYDWDKFTPHDLIGEAAFTLSELTTTKSFPVINKKKQARKGNRYKNSGELLVHRADAVQIANFVTYLQGGLRLDFIVAVDFTASNRPVDDPRSLHYMGHKNRPSQYYQALQAVGTILSGYLPDGYISALGFGAILPGFGNQASFDFALNGENDARVLGVEGLLAAYQTALSLVKLSGPTYFTPIIRNAMNIANSVPVSQRQQHFAVLLILTDGNITDLSATIDTIIEASENTPMAIVIVGVGEDRFTAMKRLDGDDGKLRNDRGDKAVKRDIVQFTKFDASKPIEYLAAEVLQEVPKQVVEFMSSSGIKPNPPVGQPPLL